jgi:hypothetical protein
MAELKKLTLEDVTRRILALPEEEQREAVRHLSQMYAREGEGVQGEWIISEGTDHEVTVAPRFMFTLEEWKESGVAELEGRPLGPDEGLNRWKARVPQYVVEAWSRDLDERVKRIEETMADFDDEE